MPQRVVEPALEAAAVDDEGVGIRQREQLRRRRVEAVRALRRREQLGDLGRAPTSSRVKSPTCVVVATIAGPSAESPDAPGLAQPTSTSAAAAAAPPAMLSRDGRVAERASGAAHDSNVPLLIMIVKTSNA